MKLVPRSPWVEPEGSPFSRDHRVRLYEQMLTERLLGAMERESQALAPAWQREENAILVCVPSFQPEWTLSVVGDRKAGYWVLLVEAQKNLWYSTGGDPWAARSPSVSLYSRELAPDLGAAVCDIWSRVLLQTRYTEELCRGCDGVTYHFVYSRRGTKSIPEKSGKTWSPEEDSVPGKLTRLSHALGDYAKDSANQDVFLSVIQDHLEWFQTHSEQFSF